MRITAKANMARLEPCTVYMQAALHGVLPVHKGQFETLQQNAMRWNNRLRQAMAVCNGLALINKTVVGVDMERSMFKAVEARFLVGAYVLYFSIYVFRVYICAHRA